MRRSLVVLAQGKIYAADCLSNSGLDFGLTLEPAAKVICGAVDHGAHREILVPRIELVRGSGQQTADQELVHGLGLIAFMIGLAPLPGDAGNSAEESQQQEARPWRRSPGSLRHHSQMRVAVLTGRARIGTPSSQRSRSSAKAPAHFDIAVEVPSPGT